MLPTLTSVGQDEDQSMMVRSRLLAFEVSRLLIDTECKVGHKSLPITVNKTSYSVTWQHLLLDWQLTSGLIFGSSSARNIASIVAGVGSPLFEFCGEDDGDATSSTIPVNLLQSLSQSDTKSLLEVPMMSRMKSLDVLRQLWRWVTTWVKGILDKQTTLSLKNEEKSCL